MTSKNKSGFQKAAIRTARTLLEGERIGYNNALKWAADWITGSAISNGNPSVIEFAENMAMSLDAHKKKPNPPGFAITPMAGFDVTAALKERGEWTANIKKDCHEMHTADHLRIAELEDALRGIQEMASEGLRLGEHSPQTSLFQIEASARAAVSRHSA